MSAKEFSLDITKFIEKTTNNVEAKVRVICLNLLSGITYKTPVDTGRARANWQTSIGSPKSSTLEATDKIGSNTIAGGQSDIKNAPGNVFWITNNLPYIYRLEFDGWSKQAPRGMVRATIDSIQRELR
jgi:hypothetical protein